jgi:NitT/TauT family transport system permease protein
MKLALPISIIGAIIGEFVASRVGIGYQIIVAYSNLDTAFVFAAVITVAVSSTILFQLLRALERRALRWKE